MEVDCGTSLNIEGCELIPHDSDGAIVAAVKVEVVVLVGTVVAELINVENDAADMAVSGVVSRFS